MEDRWQKDMPAYKRLREDGLQPPGIDGSAALEAHAVTSKQIEMGTLVDHKKIELGDRMSRDMGMNV